MTDDTAAITSTEEEERMASTTKRRRRRSADPVADLVWALQQRRMGEAAVTAAVRLCFPRSTRLDYRHGKNLISVKVEGHSGDRLRVSNPIGKTYWIDCTRIAGVLDRLFPK